MPPPSGQRPKSDHMDISVKMTALMCSSFRGTQRYVWSTTGAVSVDKVAKICILRDFSLRYSGLAAVMFIPVLQ